MAGRRLWSAVGELTEDQLRLQVLIPVLRATPNITNVTDVHGQNERGLDVIFFTQTGVERICYGVQLKTGPISGGGTSEKTVKQIVDQLELADGFAHPIATRDAGEFVIDRYVVATNGTISSTAREEIARRLKKFPVLFWDGNELIRRIHSHLPEFFRVSDGTAASYLDAVARAYNVLDALDQIPGVAKRRLSDVFEEPSLKRKFDPSLADEEHRRVAGGAIPALSLMSQGHNAVIIADQDGGKTSILRMLAITRVRLLCNGGQVSNRALPILVQAKDFVRGGFSVVDAIHRELKRHSASDLITTLEDDLGAGHYFVAVDGFSGFSRTEDKDLAADRIESFAKRFPDVHVVIAARPVDFLKPRYFESFYHYTVDDFDDRQTASLARRWIGDAKEFADVTERMIGRLRDALQLPGSPIPATIGVMLHDEQNRFITNTAEAIDRYMVIRLGRYAHELGMKQEVDWARKQDLLAEVAFTMVAEDREMMTPQDFALRIDEIQARQGDRPTGNQVVAELVDTGVLAQEDGSLHFHRTSFKEFFAGHHIYQRGDLDRFAIEQMQERKWGGALVFAAGLRRKNSVLLGAMSGAVSRRRARIVGDPDDDVIYGGYLTGRVLANSEASDHPEKVAALRTCLSAAAASVPELEGKMVAHYGGFGHLMALIGTEHTFSITIGVPWVRQQLRTLLEDTTVNEDERYLLASAYTHLGFDDSLEVLERAVRDCKSTRVIVTLQILLRQVMSSRRLAGKEASTLERLLVLTRRRLSTRSEQVKKLWELKSEILKVERKRMHRVAKQKRLR